MTPACGVGGREAAFELNEVDRRRPAGQRRVDAAVAPGTGGARRVAGSDAKVAFQAIRRLIAAPEPAVALLKQRLSPATAASDGGTGER